jgi:hypothetical protein
MDCHQDNSDLSFPSICIPFSRMHYGIDDDIPITTDFVERAFSRYGKISSVVLKLHSSEITHLGPVPKIEHYYRFIIQFERWHVENGEARYVRSVMMSPDQNANIKLAYDGPWYWKFFALRHQTHREYYRIKDSRI